MAIVVDRWRKSMVTFLQHKRWTPAATPDCKSCRLRQRQGDNGWWGGQNHEREHGPYSTTQEQEYDLHRSIITLQ